MNIKNRTAIVTGGTKGIGLATVDKLQRAGANVVVSARTQGEIDEVVNSFNSSRVVGKRCDVQQADEVEQLISFTVEQFKSLDILINNAGIGIFEPVEKMSVESWTKVINTNLNSLFYSCHYAIPRMKPNGGFIINIGSLAGKNAFPGGAAYNASKFALIGFSEALMQEVRHDDIQVAYIMPGSVDTWFGGNPPVGEESWKIAAEDVAQVILETLQRHSRCLTSRIEMRPSRPPKKS
jgi:NAD(P)-dependent dehydrogenase (short-subunit alcohol dehydrogenase family)